MTEQRSTKYTRTRRRMINPDIPFNVVIHIPVVYLAPRLPTIALKWQDAIQPGVMPAGATLISKDDGTFQIEWTIDVTA